MTSLRTDDAPASTAKSSDKDETADLPEAPRGAAAVGRAVTIRRPRAELFACWRDFGRLASLMENVVRVETIDGKRSHWVVKAPGGETVEWNARITDEREDELIAWASEEGADIANSGRVTFRDAGARGTVVTATIAYDPPGGGVGRLVARLFQREPGIQARRDLRRFKQLMETGEIATGARNRRVESEEGQG